MDRNPENERMGIDKYHFDLNAAVSQQARHLQEGLLIGYDVNSLRLGLLVGVF